MEHTVQTLIDYHKQLNQSRNPATIANEISALKQFIKVQGISLGSPVPACFGADGAFNREVNEYLEKAGFPDSTAHARRTCLKKVRESYLALIVDSEVPKNFPAALSYYIEKSGMSDRAICKAIGMDHASISAWRDGRKMPLFKMECVQKLEDLFELAPGTLRSLIPNRKKSRVTGTTSFGRYLLSIRGKNYTLNPENWPEKCIRQFEALASFKEADILPPGVSRSKESRWRREKNNWGGTKSINKRMLSSFWGYLLLATRPSGTEETPQTLPGQGMELDTLGLENFVKPELVEGYINFMRERSNGGFFNGQTKVVLACVTSLVNPDHGFILQYPRLFPGFQEKELKNLCKKAHERYGEIKRQLDGKYRKTRDPEEPCRSIIQCEDPLSLLIQLCERAQKYAEDRWAGRFRISTNTAVDFRNALILGMMRYMPLRAKNYCLMTWKSDNTGHLNRRPDGAWWLDVPADQFKNERGAAGDRPYSVQISKTLWAQIEKYLQVYRPLFLKGKKSDYVFLERNRPVQRLTGRNFYMLIRKSTHSFSPIPTPGFGPHAFRHLVATGMLKDDPSAVETVATVLHDRVETVRKSYAHLLVNDGQKHFNSHMEKKQRDMEDDEGGQEQALPTLSAEQILRVLNKLSPAEKRRVMAGVANG